MRFRECVQRRLSGSGRVTANPEVTPFLAFSSHAPAQIKVGEEWPTNRPEPGLSANSLLNALPQQLVLSTLSVKHSTFPIFAGYKDKAIIALKLEPSHVIGAAPIGGA